MKLDFITLDQLSVSKANMRCGAKPPDIDDLLPSVRARGVLVPLLVRPNCDPGCFEIVAGRRRFHAALAVKAEQPEAEPEPLPCAILDDSDDAAALEASLIENIARLDPDEVSRWETFTRLVKEGRSLEDISATFGLPPQAVKRILALGNLLPRIRDLYRQEKIDAGTVRHLTLASKRQQKDWLALFDSPDSYAPVGSNLKAWLFGGASIMTDKALFDVEASGLAIVADLFGEGGYFADPQAFWTAQNTAIEERKAAYLAEGWKEVILLAIDDHFYSWEFEKTPKRKGGKVYIQPRPNGEIAFHEGYLSRREARQKEGGEAPVKPSRPEASGPCQAYLDLHRHAAVRAEIAAHPGVALRLMVAHAIHGSPLWHVRVEPQRSGNEAIQESVEGCASEAIFDIRRRSVMALLGLGEDEPTVTGGFKAVRSGDALSEIFLPLVLLTDEQLFDVAAIVMGETLSAGTEIIETVGLHLGVEMGKAWAADDAFLDLIRDREILLAMVAELAGEEVAKANEKEKGKALKAIIRDCLTGSNGRAKADHWVPKWIAFPPAHYTGRGGVGTVLRHARIASMFETEAAEGQREAA